MPYINTAYQKIVYILAAEKRKKLGGNKLLGTLDAKHFFIAAEMPVAFVYPGAADMTFPVARAKSHYPAVKIRTGGRTYVAFTDFANNYHSFSILT